MILAGWVALAAAAEPTELDREAAALWGKARAGAPAAEWADLPNLHAVEGVNEEGFPFPLETSLDYAIRLGVRAARGGPCKPGRTTEWPLPSGLAIEAEVWPMAPQLRGLAVHDLGCPTPETLSAALLVRYEGGPWRILDLPTRDELTTWTQAIEDQITTQADQAAAADRAKRKEEARAAQAATAPTTGVEGGVEGVSESGPSTGGTDNGPAPLPSEGVRTVHWSEVQVKLRVNPAAMEGVEGVCTMRIQIDSKGVPTGVEPETCPDALVENTRAALWKWRFYPNKVGGVAVPVQFVLRVNYQSNR